MSKKRLIPFRLLPGSWGLEGRVYLEAKAHYDLDGEALERRLLEIRHCDDPTALALALLDLDLKHGRIDAYQHDLSAWEIQHGQPIDDPAKIELDFKHGRISEFDYDHKRAQSEHEAGIAREQAILDCMLKHRKLSQNEYDKRVATLHEKPWIGIIDQGFDEELGVNGVYFEFDWNSFWIDYLRLNGYTGYQEEAIVEQWFADVCRATAAASDAADEMVVPLDAHRMATRASGRTTGQARTARTHAVRRDDGTSFFS